VLLHQHREQEREMEQQVSHDFALALNLHDEEIQKQEREIEQQISHDFALALNLHDENPIAGKRQDAKYLALSCKK